MNITDTLLYISRISTRGNQQLRSLKLSSSKPEYHDIIYVLHIKIHDVYYYKIGRTTLDRAEKRFTEHVYDWGSRNVILSNVITIPHPKIEHQFHAYMSRVNNQFVADIQTPVKKYKEFYIHDTKVLDTLFDFLKKSF